MENPPLNNEPEEKATKLIEDTDFHRLLYVAKKNFKYILLIFFLAALGCFLFLRYSVPKYMSSTVMQISTTNRANDILNNQNNTQGFYEENNISEEVSLLKSKFLLKRTLKNLPIEISYYNRGQFLSHELYKSAPFKVSFKLKDSTYLDQPFIVHFNSENSVTISMDASNHHFNKTFPINSINLPGIFIKISIANYKAILQNQNNIKSDDFSFVINSANSLADKYINRIKVDLLNPDAKTVKISVKDPNAQKATEIVRALAQEFINYDVEKRSESSRKIVEFINKQLDIAYNRLKVSEKTLQDYKKKNKLGDIDNFSTIYLKNLSDLQDQLVNLNLQIKVLEKIEGEIKTSGKNIDVANLLSIVAGTAYAENISTLIRSLYSLYSQRETIKFESTANNISLQNINNQIKIQKEILIKSIESQKQRLITQQNELNKKNNNIANKFSGLPAKQLEFARLQRMFSINEKFFSLLQEKQIEFSISEAGFVPQHLILEKAQVPSSPFSPNDDMVILGFFALALALSLFFTMISFLFRNKISSAVELESFLGSNISILGTIPKIYSDMPVSKLIVNKNLKSIVSESFRSIRTNLHFISQKEGSKTMCITSTISGEGKTFIAINLAGIIALTGKKVIILDIDLRKPKIHNAFDVKNEKGISNILIGEAALKDCIQKSKMKSLDFITAGTIPPNPSELLLSNELNDLIAELKTQYDLVVIDTPPVGLVTDGVKLISQADYPLYIFRSDFSKKQFVRAAKKLHDTHQVKNLSVILNAVNIKLGSYGNYGYGYGYGYGNTYTSSNEYYENTLPKRNFKNIFKRKS